MRALNIKNIPSHIQIKKQNTITLYLINLMMDLMKLELNWKNLFQLVKTQDITNSSKFPTI